MGGGGTRGGGWSRGSGGGAWGRGRGYAQRETRQLGGFIREWEPELPISDAAGSQEGCQRGLKAPPACGPLCHLSCHPKRRTVVSGAARGARVGLLAGQLPRAAGQGKQQESQKRTPPTAACWGCPTGVQAGAMRRARCARAAPPAAAAPAQHPQPPGTWTGEQASRIRQAAWQRLCHRQTCQVSGRGCLEGHATARQGLSARQPLTQLLCLGKPQAG